ncbi:Bug family tripartite tricarboxylate transporter substrate binding protein [Teichococcus oryzae]|uniref:Tripartite tricarboxylate transporter substrate binding protein n=1 Tax=Teichococcus oryzae TaxID=1608942 RepID=A0A5B2TMT3_9PROT|nr:tripartite tricarboxylate transporter substrate binding protein [Pseudoroseomonas oryzae]KAA2215010.1 tripartite tricarboxylate transporter substrate binding protein [Pseudoroseomonas oryzae]
MMRRPLLALALAGLLSPLSALAQDASWPNRPITLMGGFPNGSGVDIYARKLAEPLSRVLGVPVVVDNRSGAGGNIASDFVAKARPDGYTFLFGTAGTHAINATLYRNLPFDPVKDSTAITHLGDVPNVMTVSPEKRPQFNSCAAVVAAAKAAPGRLNYASTGNGASTHLAGAQFIQVAGLDMVHVPFRGQPGAQTALLAGDVDVFFNQSGPAIGYIQQGQVKGLAVTTAQRLPALPDVPTVAEACGLPGFDSSTWYGIFAPPGLPEAIQTRMNAEIQRIITAPDFRKWLIETQGITPSTIRTPEEFRAVQIRDIERWGEVVRKSGAQVD